MSKRFVFINFLIAFAISSTSLGFIKIATSLLNISKLNGKFDDIIGSPQAMASITELGHPSAKEGSTKTSAQFK